MTNTKKVIIIVLSGFLILAGIIGVILYGGINSYNNNQNTKAEGDVDTIDATAPTLTLNTESNDNGDYFVNLIRNTETDTFDPLSLVASVTDDYSEAANIKITCDDTLDITKSTQYIYYTATDEAGNSSKTKLLVIYNDDPEKIKAEQEAQIAQMSEEIAQLEAEEKARQEEEERRRKEEEERRKAEEAKRPAQPQTQPSNNGGGSGGGDTPSAPSKPANVFHTVNNFTISGDGDIQSQLQSGAMANCSYGGCGGSLYAANFDIGDSSVTIHWTCTCGWTGTSVAKIK